jgi:hypothetical protein
MKIFDYVIGRTCFLQDNKNLLTVNQRLEVDVLKYHTFLDSLAEKKRLVLDELHRINLGETDKKINNAIQNIRRNIYNDKPIKKNDLERITEHKFKDLEIYIALSDNLKQEYDQLKKSYDEVIDSNRELVLEYTNKLKNGLLLSSDSILEYIEYLKSGKGIKKTRGIDLGLLKYVTRSIYKPTPFSSFTYLSLGKLNNDSKFEELVSDNIELDLNSFVNLNNYLQRYFKKLISNLPDIYFHLSLDLNQTLCEVNNRNEYKFFVNKQNLEYYQTIQKSAILELIIKEIEKTPDMTFGALNQTLLENVDADDEGVQKYVLELITSGLLELKIPIAGTDIFWVKEMVSFLIELPLQSESKDLIIETLKTSLSIVEKYGVNPSFDERRKLLSEVTSILNECEQTFNNSDNFARKIQIKTKNYIYEDCYSTNQFSLSKSFMSTVIHKLNDLVDLTYNLPTANFSQNLLYEYYLKCVQSENIGFLEFFEAYSMFIKNDIESETAKEIMRSVEAKQPFKIDNENLSLESDKLGEKVIVKIKSPKVRSISQDYSLCTYFQFLNIESENPKVVINSMSWGYGKMFSRFLYMFDDEVISSIRDLNKMVCGDAIGAELNDSSYFNANLHPSLFESECIIPGCHKKSDIRNFIKLTDLKVVPIHKEKRLAIYSKVENQEVLIQECNFEGYKNKSRLYTFLTHFSRRVNPAHHSLLLNINKEYSKKLGENIIFYPRIELDEGIVLQRKKWKIAANNEFNFISGVDDTLDSFLKINKWREQYGIPKEVFVVMKGEKPESKKVTHKPQYINFSVPVFTRLVLNILTSGLELHFTEALPSVNDETLNVNKNRVTEYLTQWYVGDQFK